MTGRLAHVAIAVPDLETAADRYRNLLGADVAAAVDLPDHGVTSVLVTLPNVKIELLHPLGSVSPVAAFLNRNPSGGVHHLCYEVDDISAATGKLCAEGMRILDTSRAPGMHGKPVVFLHPGDFHGVLVELVES